MILMELTSRQIPFKAKPQPNKKREYPMEVTKTHNENLIRVSCIAKAPTALQHLQNFQSPKRHLI